jgi:hypothetical protein
MARVIVSIQNGAIHRRAVAGLRLRTEKDRQIDRLLEREDDFTAWKT